MPPVISVENLSKTYRLGQISTGTFTYDLAVWWAKLRGKPNPMLRIGEKDHGNRDGEELWALRDINFTVEQGEVLGIIGRNGAGKSTLLKILSRVTAPTSGRIRVKGRVASLLEVGTGFHPELTGRENIYLNGAILGMTRQEVTRKFDEIVDFAEVEKFIDTPVKRYSSGMYVRLAFAVAANLDADILLVDEVLAVGDAAFQRKCLSKISEIGIGGRTIFFVSHSMPAITSLCERVIWIEKGLFAQDGSSQQVVIAYQSDRNISGGRLEWLDGQGPGDGLLKIQSITLRDVNGNINVHFPISQKITVDVVFEVLHPGVHPLFIVRVNNPNHGLIFWSLSNGEENLLRNMPLEIGKYKATCVIPGNLLSEDQYYITISFRTDFNRKANNPDDGITFVCFDDGELRGDFFSRYRGIVRPKLYWDVGRLD
jgi:lipopolysaccharide transport system ATP-binding protein